MVLLVLLNGFFVSAEFAIVKVKNSRIEALAEEGRRNARIAKELLSRLDGYLSACQVGITLSSLGLGWLGEPVVARMLGPLFEMMGFGERPVVVVSLAVSFMLIAILHIVLGELAPKTIAVRKAETILLWFAWPMRIFYRLMYPFIWMLNGLSSGLLRLFGIAP
ncbi:MAG: CNNM domain-containing protein, partial [Paenibacillus sp.]